MRSTARTTLAASIPAALMLVCALVQMRLAHTQKLSPWKGGGFGMFATTDGGPNRRVRIYLGSEGREQSVTPASPELRKLAEQAGTLPTDHMLGRLAHALGEQARREGHEADHVRVEVWRNVYAKSTLASEQILLAERTVELDRTSH